MLQKLKQHLALSKGISSIALKINYNFIQFQNRNRNRDIKFETLSLMTSDDVFVNEAGAVYAIIRNEEEEGSASAGPVEEARLGPEEKWKLLRS